MTETEQLLSDEVASLQAKNLALTARLDEITANPPAPVEKIVEHVVQTDNSAALKNEVARIIFENAPNETTPEQWARVKAWCLNNG